MTRSNSLLAAFTRMLPLCLVTLSAAAIGSTCAAVSSQPRSLEQIRTDYQAALIRLQPHLIDEQWLDDDARAPEYLNALWAISQRWITSWLNAHPAAGAQDVVAAVRALDVNARPNCLKLADDVFLIAGPSAIANVFIVDERKGAYEVAWSIANNQNTNGLREPDVIAAWRAENARYGGRGPYFASSGSGGSLAIPDLGILASDSNNRPRFYIDALYAQSAGMTVGKQTSIWRWNGTTAEPLMAHSYTIALDTGTGVRIVGQDLKVREKQDFRSFFPSGPSEGRRVDWVVRVTPKTVEDLGEKSAVPHLDLLDDLFDRIIRGGLTDDIASPGAIRAARRIVRAAQSDSTPEQWEKFPTLGMIVSTDSEIEPRAVGNGKESICLELGAVGGVRATFERLNGALRVADVLSAECPR
jgi:hypothetical protein